MKLTTVLFAACSLFAQAPKSFEVATVKPSAKDSRPGAQIQGERFIDSFATLVSLTRYAYDAEPYQISGAPPWASQDIFDIQASAGTGVQLTEALAKEMLRSLLAERFGLRMHRESKEMDVMLLVTNGSPKLTRSTRTTFDGYLLAATGAETRAATMRDLASLIERFGDRGRPVVDRTGLDGFYEFKLNFATLRNAPDASLPDIVTALREQLNLRLQPAKESIEVWIVDAVTKPSEN